MGRDSANPATGQRPGWKSKIRKFAGRLLLVFSATLIALLLSETLSRIVLDPVDFLKPRLIADDVLIRRIEPNSAGHDEWGFRNDSVPPSAEIVVVGDSQTYGVSAKAVDAWPAALQRVMSVGVYNLALGGYGPVQYHYLVAERALDLSPSLVIVGLYLGNDILDSFRLTYGDDRWSHWRQPGIDAAAAKAAIQRERKMGRSTSFHRQLRTWLAEHSVVYRLVTSSVVGSIARRLQMKAGTREGDVYLVESHEHGIYTGLTPKLRYRSVNMQNIEVQEGLRITREIIRSIHQRCRENDVALLVVLIPTKESVYRRYVELDDGSPHALIFTELWSNEVEIAHALTTDCEEAGIRCLSVVDYLQRALPGTAIYPENDGHPNRLGYDRIARCISAYLSSDADSRESPSVD